MRSREVIQLIEADSWYEVEVKGREATISSDTRSRKVGSPFRIPKVSYPKALSIAF